MTYIHKYLLSGGLVILRILNDHFYSRNKMCTWLHLRFECGAVKKRDDIRLKCEHLEQGSCVGRWGHHYVKFLNIPFDCLGIAPHCATCPGGTSSKASRAWLRTTINSLVAREVAFQDDAIKWITTNSVADIIPPEPDPVSTHSALISSYAFASYIPSTRNRSIRSFLQQFVAIHGSPTLQHCTELNQIAGAFLAPTDSRKRRGAWLYRSRL